MHQELSTLRSQIDTRSRGPVGGAEDFNARPVRKEERVELENLVIFGKGRRRRTARSVETCDGDGGEPKTAYCCDTFTT